MSALMEEVLYNYKLNKSVSPFRFRKCFLENKVFPKGKTNTDISTNLFTIIFLKMRDYFFQSIRIVPKYNLSSMLLTPTIQNNHQLITDGNQYPSVFFCFLLANKINKKLRFKRLWNRKN